MKFIRLAAVILPSLALLAGCGAGSDAPSHATHLRLQGGAAPAAVVHAPEEYRSLVQQIYLAYFGRPADVSGWHYWMQKFSDQELPLQSSDLTVAYASDAKVKQLIDAFVNSEESQGLYTGSNEAFVNSVYRNLFNRNAETDGLNFWTGFLGRGQLTRGQMVLYIATGAQNDDAVIEKKKVQAAINFSASIEAGGYPAIVSYSGDGDNQAARELLATITTTTDLAAFQPQIDALALAVQRIPGNLPAVQRYSGFQYLQDMTVSGPAYAAYYRDPQPYHGTPSRVPLAAAGTLTLGVVPQASAWARGADGMFSYGAPFAASVRLAQLASYPGDPYDAVTMLCQENGKSTDILVSNKLHAVASASELANQTFSIYRENCGAANANVKSYAFDANGAATVTLSAGVSTYNVDAVNQILKGQVLLDLPSGSYLTLKVYRYIKVDGHDGYVMVQHQGRSLTKLSDGSLGMWSQE